MIVLDSNVVSELLRPIPEPRVVAWLAAQNGAQICLSAVSEAELRRGVGLLPSGRKRASLADAIEAILTRDCAGRVLPIDSVAAVAFAEIFVQRRVAGRPISFSVCQIASAVSVYAATMATRNVADFEGCGIDVINPWHHELDS